MQIDALMPIYAKAKAVGTLAYGEAPAESKLVDVKRYAFVRISNINANASDSCD